MEITQSKLLTHSIPLKNKQSSMTGHKNSVKRTTIQQEDEQYHLLEDSLKILDNLFQMRFIQNISRPIQKRTKEEIVQKYAGKMETLHNKLEKIKSELAEKNSPQNGNGKQKSVLGSATHQPIDWKKSIRNIENRYMEVFYEGSFKFYKKLYFLNKFSFTLPTINIQDWASICLNKNDAEACC